MKASNGTEKEQQQQHLSAQNVLNKQPQKSNDNPMAQTAVAAVETTHSQSNSEFDQVKRLNTQYKYRRTRNNFDSFEFTCFNFHHWLHLVCSIYLVAL